MVDIKYYTKLLFNEETGKERYSLAQKEAEKSGKNLCRKHHSILLGFCYGML